MNPRWIGPRSRSQKAVEAVRQCKSKPATIAGKAVLARVNVEVGLPAVGFVPESKRLRSHRDRSLPGRPRINQFHRMNALGRASIAKENQAVHGQCAIALRQSGVLHL